MNIRTTLSDAVRLIAAPRLVTNAALTARMSTDGITHGDGTFNDYEVRMTRGIVDDGISADPQYRVTGGVTT